MTNNYTHTITTALYYANGSLHIGHMLEAVQADIYVRFLRQNGQKPLFLSGSDAHGTPIMLASKAKNIAAKAMVAAYQAEHKATFAAYNISFDNYHSTDSDENKALTEKIFGKITKNIFTKTIEQAYDATANMFLPDRFIKGTCPKCAAADQYGDSCEHCGAFYEPLAMIEPRSTISNTTPVAKSSKHIFFDLPACQAMLEQFLAKAELEKPVKNKLSEWLEAGLNPWDISRDAPYYGFEIPGYPNKFFYVWLDAPIGYIASAVNLKPEYEQLWHPDSNSKIVHFIGKDIMYFHGLFWPAMLASAGYKQPEQIIAHGFLTLNGEKMSKSRGTMLAANDFLKTFSAEHFRYYIASKLSNGVDDIDLNLEDFIQKNNSDLIGKYLNIASRTANFITKKFSGKLLAAELNSDFYATIKQESENALKHYSELNFAKACKAIMNIADLTNQLIAEQQPWAMAKIPEQLDACHLVCSNAIAAFIDVSILLKPILPELVAKVEEFLNLPNLSNADLHQNRAEHMINPYPRLMERIPDSAASEVL